MSHKTLIKISLAGLILSALIAVPIGIRAQSACGAGTYTVSQDETVDTLAATCGTSSSAIYAANPEIGPNLYAGQVITMPGYSTCAQGNCAPNTNNCYQNNCAPNYNNCYQNNCAPDYSNCYQNNCAPNYNNCYQNNCAPNTNNCYQNNCAPDYNNCYQGNCNQTSGYGNTYVVQYGDTFSGIASRFGISMYDLWTVNQNIGDYNLLYPGQVLNLPQTSGMAPTPPPYYGSQSYPPYYVNQTYPPQNEYQSNPPYYGYQSYPPYYGYYPPYYGYQGYVPTPTPETPITYGTVPPGAPRANIQLSNNANAKVFVSLEGTARDGTSIVREYQVYGTFTKEVPAGYYNYTAWVGGVKYSGSINLPGGSWHSLTFHSHEVDAQ